jgi:hypothetical protein
VVGHLLPARELSVLPARKVRAPDPLQQHPAYAGRQTSRLVKVKRVRPKGRWVIGIDQSYGGFAMAMRQPDSGVLYVMKMKPPSKKIGVDRLIDIGAWMTATIDTLVPRDAVAHVCMEGYAQGSKFGREIAGELGGEVKSTLRRMFAVPVCYPTIVPPTKLKKFTTDNGAAKKDQMMLAVYRKWGYEAPDNDEADAYALCRLAGAIVGAEPSLLAYEEAVVANLEVHTEWQERPSSTQKQRTNSRTTQPKG